MRFEILVKILDRDGSECAFLPIMGDVNTFSE